MTEMTEWKTVLSTEMNDQASGDQVISGTALDFQGCELVDIIAKLAFAAAPSAGTLQIYAVFTDGAANWVQGSASVNPASNLLIATLEILATTETQYLGAFKCDFPISEGVKIIARQNGTAALESAGSWVKIKGHVR